MAQRIELLPEHVANQIAAGEVVQRPASVVKELLENALDAGATDIQLIVREGGKTLIQVVDNGAGMDRTDAELSIVRHATSKIRKAEDLFQIHTMGFRGEALASIAAIARLELQTRNGDEALGTHLKIAGGTLESVQETVVPQGTSIQVKNLFFNIPARRNFLKSSKIEYRHVLEEFQRVALAHPGISFKLFHNDSEIFNIPESKLRRRIGHLFGSRMNDRLVPIEEETQVVKVEGFICKPEFAKKGRGMQFFFVNNRYIKSSYLHHAVMNAYEGLLRPDTVPGYFIFLHVPADSIDINIHPTKTEIKFENEQSVYAILRAAVKHSLGQFNIRPVLDFEANQNLETPYNLRHMSAQLPQVEVDRNFNPFREEATPSIQRKDSYKASGDSWTALYEGLGEGQYQEGAKTHWIVESDAPSEGLFDEGAMDALADVASFQVDRKFILTRVKSGLLLIDQQRAHQRVLYEQFLENISLKEPVSQTLLFPMKLPFDRGDLEILTEMNESMKALGFAMEEGSDGDVIISALPVLIPDAEVGGVLEELLTNWKQQLGTEGFSEADRMARLLSRALSIRPGRVLDTASRQALINDLFACKDPDRSPFNKKIHTTFGVDELEKKLQ
ncbi:MAG: DNA mismatch repair endonuclease MutL [Robiginitalea sp.]|uniref:DNA mismatch repair endonuclease MutL n=2 Tax=Robiginitalea sp. TaxID=1902411 RepID=UPI003C790B8A